MNKNTDTELIRATALKKQAKTWELTGIDQSVFSYILRGTWIFRNLPNVQDMKSSLEKLLMYYPHLTGRMEKKRRIILNNSGVPFTFTHEPGMTMNDVREKSSYLDQCSPCLSNPGLKSGKIAPMSVKLTKLRDGYILVIKCSHTCLDGAGFYTMVYNWARLCSGQSITPPVLDQSLLPQKSNNSKDKVKQAVLKLGFKKLSFWKLIKMILTIIPVKLLERTKTLYISRETLLQLKRKISKESGCQCSTNVALSAYLTTMIIRLLKHSGTTSCTHVTVIDMRKRLPDIPPSFAGNASFTVPTPCIRADASMGEIAHTIHHTLAPFLKPDSMKLLHVISLSIDVISHRLSYFPYDVSEMLTKKPTVIYMNNFSRLPVYDVDFGTGKPVAVIPHNLGDQVLIWPADPSKGGVEVYFTGIIAWTINKLLPGTPWLKQLKKFDVE